MYWLGWCTLWKHHWRFPSLRDMVALAKGAWEHCCSFTKRYFVVLFPCLEVTCAELEDFVQLCVLWGCSSQWSFHVCQCSWWQKLGRSWWQIPQGKESSSLQYHPRTRRNLPGQVLYKMYEKGIVLTLEAAQVVLLQQMLIIPLDNLLTFYFYWIFA